MSQVSVAFAKVASETAKVSEWLNNLEEGVATPDKPLLTKAPK